MTKYFKHAQEERNRGSTDQYLIFLAAKETEDQQISISSI